MKIAIAHFRIGLTDGVSLIIDERVQVLKKLGHDIVYIAGSKSPIGNLKIPMFEYKGISDINSLERVEDRALEIEEAVTEFWLKEKFSHIFLHNFFSLPVCLPATLAFFNFLKKHSNIVGIAVHHDFWWDPPRIKKFDPDLIGTKFENLLDKYFPPKLSNFKHTVISKWEHQQLKKRRGLDSYVITDTFDFNQKTWTKNEQNKNFLKDSKLSVAEIKILMAARIRERKGMEIGIQLAYELQKKTAKKVVILMPNDFFKQEEDYIDKLKNLAENLRVEIRWLQNLVGSEEEKILGYKKYSLWDCYVYSDIIVYPSLWEGFGNQFLEAVFAKKPVAVFEYPVFKTDIKPYGFNVVSLGDSYSHMDSGLAQIESTILRKSAIRLLALIKDIIKINRVMEKNFLIAKENFNTNAILRNHLVKILK